MAKPKLTQRDPIPDLIESLLADLGEDPSRQGLKATPSRVSRALRELTDGYGVSAADIIAGAVFDQDYDEMVLVKDIPFYSLCEHHMLPFFGSCHVGYLPKGKVVGLSKIPRIVGAFAHRLQLQERLTKEIAEALNEAVAPKGVGVVVEARHLCMEMRGVQKPGGQLITSCMLGTFRKDARTRAEFLDLIRRPYALKQRRLAAWGWRGRRGSYLARRGGCRAAGEGTGRSRHQHQRQPQKRGDLPPAGVTAPQTGCEHQDDSADWERPNQDEPKDHHPVLASRTRRECSACRGTLLLGWRCGGAGA